MEELLLKFYTLDSFRRQELLDFLEFLLLKQTPPEVPFTYEEYKQRILEVSVWSDEDIALLEENRKKIDQWQVPEW